MDEALMILIGLTASYAGVIAFLLSAPRGTARAALVGAGTLVAVAAGFVLAVALAQSSLLAMFGLIALLVGAGTYPVVRGDLGRRRAVRTAVAAALVVTAASVLISYLAPMAYVVTASTYLLLRLWVSTRPAMIVMGAAFSAMLVLCGAVFAYGISQM